MPGRLIDAHDLIESFLNTDADVCAEYYDYGCDWGFSLKSIINLIQNAPTVDAVPVVRCKDCKYGGMFVIEDKVPFFACYKDRPDIKPVKRDWFCADGVKRDTTGGHNETV